MQVVRDKHTGAAGETNVSPAWILEESQAQDEVGVTNRRPGNVGGPCDRLGMHELEELRADEDADRLFVVWVCECGDQGRAATQQTAHTGWRKHLERADRMRCLIVPASPPE